MVFHGDTDIFPLPFENLLFKDISTQAGEIIENIHKDHKTWLSSYPPQTVPTLTQVGYAGFRWATLIDPFWNAYYLTIVLQIADQIEEQRIPQSDNIVFSYRFNWQPHEAKLFKESSWIDFRTQCLLLSNSFPVIVQTDIADFYPRIYHHRLENALQRLRNPGDTPKRIMDLLGAFSFSTNVSYGLPIGGPASRILAELALDGVDTLLVRKGIHFCRYADDYVFFCNDKAEAYRTLVFLSEKLANEGLVLQKKKTRILSSDEFRQVAQLLDPAALDDKLATDEQKLLNISLKFDPYAPRPDIEYELLKEAVSKVDIIGILSREIAKPTIDSVVTKQAINAIMALETPQQEKAIETLLKGDNLMTLAPVFTTVMRVIKSVYVTSANDFKTKLDTILCNLWTNCSPPLSVEVNLAYYIQALAGNQTKRKEEILVSIFDNIPNPIIRRLIILAMTKWNCFYWLTDIKNKYGAMSMYERRAFILASYYLGDEGDHWRKYTKSTWAAPETLVRDWFCKRFQTNRSVPL